MGGRQPIIQHHLIAKSLDTSGSVELERIDLSLVGDHEHPTINPEPPISVSAVVIILDSITGTEGNSLLHLQLPKKMA